jgi:hypothetical protein
MARAGVEDGEGVLQMWSSRTADNGFCERGNIYYLQKLDKVI